MQRDGVWGWGELANMQFFAQQPLVRDVNNWHDDADGGDDCVRGIIPTAEPPVWTQQLDFGRYSLVAGLLLRSGRTKAATVELRSASGPVRLGSSGGGWLRRQQHQQRWFRHNSRELLSYRDWDAIRRRRNHSDGRGERTIGFQVAQAFSLCGFDLVV